MNTLLRTPAEPNPGSGHRRPTSEASLRQMLDRWVETRRFAGLQYLVARQGRPHFEHHAGVADAMQRAPVDTRTVFNLYSLTKPLTATLTLRLAERGMLDLDDEIAVVTENPALGAFGSVRAAVAHRGGFPNPLPLSWFHPHAQDDTFDEPGFVQQRLMLAAEAGPVGPRYSNVGYLALGRAVERATDLGFRQALQQHLLEGLGMENGAHLGFAPGPGQRWAIGHVQRASALNLALGLLVPRAGIVQGKAGPWVCLQPHHVNGSAYGGLIGNARALAQMGRALLGQVPGIEASVRQLAATPCEGQPSTRTLAWFRGRLRGQAWLGHAGGGLGAYAEWRLYPALGAVSVLLTNSPGLRDRRLLDGLDRLWLDATDR